MNRGVYDFVKESLERGLGRDAIRDVLVQAGWQEVEVRNALAAFADVDFPIAVPRPRPYIHAREAFFYLVSFISLYVTAFSFGALVFQIIDRTFPDSLSRGGEFQPQDLATPIASIIVAFPLYLFLMKRLAMEVAADSERRQSLVRKWLTYLTLVVGAGIIIGDLIALLSNLLGGDPTTRFVLKTLTILVIATCIFGFYLWDMRQSEQPVTTVRAGYGLRIFLGSIVAVILASLAYGIFLLGTPSGQRLVRFDDRRVSDLTDISHNIDIYWELNGELPQSLADLSGPRYFLRSIEDPATGVPYEYRALDEEKYELCAVFATDSTDRREEFSRPFSAKVWDHSVGENCFSLEAQDLDVDRPGQPPAPVKPALD